MPVALVLDTLAVFIFALTGALAASRAQLDIVGFLFFAALTAVGGGTVRDLLLDREVIFWIGRPAVLLPAVVAAVLVFFTAHLVESRARWLTWLDAGALAFAVPAGLAVALGAGVSSPVAMLMGIVTGTMGGLMRDVVANEVPMVLRQGELYITAAFAGSVTGIVVNDMLGGSLALIAAGAATFALRAGSLLFGWSLPVYKSRPPR